MIYQHTVGNFNFIFQDLKTVLAKASPEKSGDQMAGFAARNEQESIAAKLVLANIPLSQFLKEEIIPAETTAVSRLILDEFDSQAFQSVAHLTVGGFCDWLLAYETDGIKIAQISP